MIHTKRGRSHHHHHDNITKCRSPRSVVDTDRRNDDCSLRTRLLGESTRDLLAFQELLHQGDGDDDDDGSAEVPSMVAKPQPPPQHHPLPPSSPSAVAVEFYEEPHHDDILPVVPDAIPAEDETIPPPWHRTMIHLAPGHCVPLCGVAETLHAVRLDRVAGTECVSCGTFLCCADAATMVLCTVCRSVGAVVYDVVYDDEAAAVATAAMPCIGLGLTVEQIFSCQCR